MKILQMLLKLFPKSFQKAMGEAWVEASETELKNRQALLGKRTSVVLGFVLETLFVVIPSAHQEARQLQLAGFSHNVNVASYIPLTRNWLQKTLSFFIDYWIFNLLGCVASVMYFVQGENQNVEYGYSVSAMTLGAVALIAIAVYWKKMVNWWNTSRRPIVAPVVHLALGVYIGALLMLSLMVASISKDSTKVMVEYLSVRDQMGLTYNSNSDRTNMWFKNGVLRAEHKQQWCQQSTTRMQTLQSGLVSNNDNLFKGLLIGTLWSQMYTNNCIPDDNQYLAARHTLDQQTLTKYNTGHFIWPLKFVPPFNEFVQHQNAVAVLGLYSPNKYCKDYVNKTQSEIDEAKAYMVCSGFENAVSVDVSQAQNIRNHVEQTLAGS